jgi:uncharacterized iron-regulated protein
MIKLSFGRSCLALLFVGASLSVAALTGSRLADGPAARLCNETGRWLAFDGQKTRPQAAGRVIAAAAAKEVVLLGEQHDSEDHHRWQLQVLAALHAQRPDLVIGFEMFPRRLQPVLDRWVKGELTSPEFLARTEWDKVWNFPPHIYLPLFEFARLNRIPMLALNVEQTLTRAISDKGWDGVPVAEREGVGKAAPPSPAYREFLREQHQMHVEMRRHPHGDKPPPPEVPLTHFIDTQLTWDRAMAEALAGRLGGTDAAARPLVVGIMGSGHLRFGHGVPHQLRALGIQRIATLLPVSPDGECRELRPGLADALFLLPDKPLPPVEPPRLGVTLEDGRDGLRIAQVMAGSLAEKSGLQAGDRVAEMAGRPVSKSAEAIAMIRRQPPGTWLPLRILRRDEALEIVVRFPARS